MDIKKSLIERQKNFYLHHFELSKYGKNLRSLKNKYSGQRCFIIGNGPSLSAKDLDCLKKEYTFAFNRIYYIFSQTKWRPTFYCTQDEKIVKNSLHDICTKIETPYIFAPINLLWYYNLNLNTRFYFSPKQNIDENECPKFSNDISHEINVGNTVAYTAIQIAVYLGFTKIYLLGVDHSFHTYQDKNGNIVVDSNAKDYFCKEYNNDKDELFIPRLDISTLSYIAAKEYAEKHNIEIYNATRGGKLEVFRRISFDTLF